MFKSIERFVKNQREIVNLQAKLKAVIENQQKAVNKFTQGFEPKELVGLPFVEVTATYQGHQVVSGQVTAEILASMTIPATSGENLEKFGYPYMGFDITGTEDLLGSLSWDKKDEKMKEVLGDGFDKLFTPDAVFLYFYEVDGEAMGMRPEHNIIVDVIIKLA